MFELPVSVYDSVEAALTANDRRSILALQSALRQRVRDYAYLEIGSHLGGSLQPFLSDERCVVAYSIDLRPSVQPDERGIPDRYPGNSTERMLTTLRPFYREAMQKLVCFERDAREVTAAELGIRPTFCFVDGEHTDDAAFSDFESCRRLAKDECVIVFDDVHLIFRAFERAVRRLRAEGVTHEAYVLPDKIAVLELGGMGLVRAPTVAGRVAMPDATFHLAGELGRYRDAILALRRLPGARLAQKIVSVFPFGAPFRSR